MSATARDAVRADVRLRRASTAVFVTFLLAGFNFANWVSRLPAVRDALELRPEQIGLLLLVGSIGSIGALPLSGLVVERLGARRTIVGFAVLNVAGLLLAAAGVTVGKIWLVVVALVVFGIGNGVWDAAMNLEGAAVEQRLRKAIMPRFHAGFSFGTMIGAGLGAVAAGIGASVMVHLSVALGVSLVAVAVCARYYLPEGTHARVTQTEPSAVATPVPGRRRRNLGAWGEPRTLLVGLVVLAAALTEGAATDWVSLAVVDGFDADHATGALVFGVFVTAMTGMRLLGTGLLDRWGRVTVLRVCAVLSLAGLLLFALSPWLWLAVPGIVLWGLGAALGFPVGMSAASDDPLRAAQRVAVVATIGYSAFFVGPPLLGLLAEHVGYRHALLAIVLPVVVGLLVVHAARPLPSAAGSKQGTEDTDGTGGTAAAEGTDGAEGTSGTGGTENKEPGRTVTV